MADSKNPTPTRMGGHTSAPAVGAPRVDVAQQIDGQLYSTRGASLIHTNGKGESLYSGQPGYFLVSVSRLIGNQPVYCVRPLPSEELQAWATANGVLDRVVVKGAGLGTALIAKLVRDGQKRSGASAEAVLKKIVRERPDEVAALLAQRIGS